MVLGSGGGASPEALSAAAGDDMLATGTVLRDWMLCDTRRRMRGGGVKVVSGGKQRGMAEARLILPGAAVVGAGMPDA